MGLWWYIQYFWFSVHLQYYKWGDSLVKFSNVNIISHSLSKRNINDQLKTIREKKHKGYHHNAGGKSVSLDNNKNNKNSTQFDNLHDRNVDKNQAKSTNNQSPWSLGTCVIVVILW